MMQEYGIYGFTSVHSVLEVVFVMFKEGSAFKLQ